jgi:anti-anti-sigma factor
MAEGAVVAANRVGPRRRSDGVDLLWLGVRRPVDGVVVLEVIGEIDLLSAPLLWSAIRRQAASRLDLVVLDLHGVRFLGACGLAVLLTARDLLPAYGTALRLARAPLPVVRPLQVLDLAKGFDVRDDVAAAIADPPPVKGPGRGHA